MDYGDWILWIFLGAGVVLVTLRLFLRYPKPPVRYRYLRRDEVSFLQAAAEATFPPGGAIPVSGRDADLPGYLDEYFAAIPRMQRFQIRLLIAVFEQSPLVFPATGRGGHRRFSLLSAEQRIGVLRRWSQSRFYLRRLLFTAIRAVITFGYLANKRVVRHLGLAPYDIETPIAYADLLYPAVGQPLDSIPYSEADLTAPSQGIPLRLDGPRHPDYREGGG